MGPGIGHHSMGEVSSLKVVHRLEQPEDTPVDQGILMEPIGIKERSSIVLPVVEDKLAYLKQKEQLLEHFRKEPPIFEFLQEPQGLGLLRQHIVT